MKIAWGFGSMLGLVGSLALAAACNTEDAPDENVGGGGTGGTGGAGCTIDNQGSAGAIGTSTAVPASGSWCPTDGLEVCSGPNPGFTTLTLPDGGMTTASIQSRCVANAWQNEEVEECEPSNHPGCNIPARFTDGACCTAVRYCYDAVCDGERWWTNGER